MELTDYDTISSAIFVLSTEHAWTFISHDARAQSDAQHTFVVAYRFLPRPPVHVPSVPSAVPGLITDPDDAEDNVPFPRATGSVPLCPRASNSGPEAPFARGCLNERKAGGRRTKERWNGDEQRFASFCSREARFTGLRMSGREISGRRRWATCRTNTFLCVDFYPHLPCAFIPRFDETLRVNREPSLQLPRRLHRNRRGSLVRRFLTRGCRNLDAAPFGCNWSF